MGYVTSFVEFTLGFVVELFAGGLMDFMLGLVGLGA